MTIMLERTVDPLAGPVDTMKADEWAAMAARGMIRRFADEADWLASLTAEDYDGRVRQHLREAIDGGPDGALVGPAVLAARTDLWRHVERRRKREGVFQRSTDPTLFGKPTLAEGLLMYKGGEMLWRCLRGDVGNPAGNLVFFGGNAVSGDSANYTPGANNATRIDVGSNATAIADPGDRGRNTLRTPGSTGRRQMDSGYWKVKSVVVTPASDNRVAQFLSTFPGSEMINAWQEFCIVQSATRTATWALHDNTMLDIFTSDQGTKASGQVWAITIEFTLG